MESKPPARSVWCSRVLATGKGEDPARRRRQSFPGCGRERVPNGNRAEARYLSLSLVEKLDQRIAQFLLLRLGQYAQAHQLQAYPQALEALVYVLVVG